MRIGIDLGGTKIEGVVMAPDGSIAVRKRIDSPKDYAAALDVLSGLVAALEQEAGQNHLPVGIGHPGAVSPLTGLMKNANSTHLNGRAFAADIRARLGRPVALANDANCFALSEATDGAGKDAEVVFGVILGTGVGGGLVVHGRVLTGPQAIAGEWGHNPLPWPTLEENNGPRCWCGKVGCIESWLSGPAFEHWAGTRLDAASPANLALYADRLARGLASVINILDPDVIVLGGGLSDVEALYPLVNAALGHYVFTDTPTTRVVKHHHGGSSGVRGAAWLNAG